MEAKILNLEKYFVEDLYCIKCHSESALILQNEGVRCRDCKQVYPIENDIVDFLYDPSADTVKELTGMALESGYKKEDYNSFKIKHNAEPMTLTQKLESTKDDYNQYYQQTQLHFEQGLEELEGRIDFSKAKVLEIGSVFDYYFLRSFEEKGAECYALNIHYFYSDKKKYRAWPKKVIADMNEIPFQKDLFDVVIISATSHHSNTPEKLVQEIHRILTPGGYCLMINDPTNGLVKSLGSKHECMRHDHINENEYSIGRYNRMFKKSGFNTKQLFSRFYDQKLLNAEIHPHMRFAFIAKILVRFWKIKLFRSICKSYLLWPAQAIFGFPMNAVIKKK